MDEKLNIINPEDKEYYDGKFYMVGIYPGAGVELATFYVYASCEEEALELVVAYLDMQPTESNLLYTTDEIEDYISESFADEFQAYMEENPDADTFQFATDYLGYYYIDATMHGASQPYFVEGNNLRVEETNDEPIVFESKEVKVESSLIDNDDIEELVDIARDLDEGHSTTESYGYTDICFSIFRHTDDNYYTIKAWYDDENGNEVKLDEAEVQKSSLKSFFRNSIQKAFEKGYVLDESKKEEDCTQAGAIQGPTTIFGSKDKKEESTEISNDDALLFKEIADTMVGRLKEDDYLTQMCFGEEADSNTTYYDTIKGICDDYNVDYDSISDYGQGIIEDMIENALFGHTSTEQYIKDVFGITNLEESIQAVADIATKIRNAREQVENDDFNYDEFVSEIKQDTMRLSDRTEQETAATLLQDFCKDYKGRTANKDNQEIESKELKTEYYQMPDDEHIIWDSEVDYYDEDYMKDIKENQYQDYLDNFEPSVPLSFEDWLNTEECYDNHYHWFEDSGIEEGDWDGLVELYKAEFQEDYDDYIEDYKDEPLDFDTWYSNYISDSSYEDWEMLEEDLVENIFPNIDNQVNDSVLVLSGYYGSNYPDFKSSGAGGKLFTDGTKGFRGYMGGFDRVCITTQDGILGAICNDHDGTVSGQFYTLPDDKTELIKALGYEEIIKDRYDEEDLDKYDAMDLMETEFNNDLMYDGIDARDLTEHLDLLKPIKDTISEYTTDPEGTKTESKKLDERFMEFPTEQEKDEYIKENNLEKDVDYKDKGPTVIELLKENKKVKTESKSDVDLEELAKDLLDWYGSDLENWFDDIQGNEEDLYNSLLSMLEDVNKEQLTNVIQDIQEADIDDETAKEKGYATTSSLLDRLNKVYYSDKEVKTENNKIPRNWKKITYKSKIDTNVDSVGDTIEVERDEWNRPIATNLRTGKTALMFLDMLRNDELSEIINIETADKETESKKVECKELKTESVSYQDLVIAGESLWRDDARIYETRVEGIYDCQTAGHGGYLVDTDVFPELAKYGDKTPIDNIVGFEEDYEALKVIWAVPEVLEKIQLDKDWYKNLTLDDVLRYDDKLNDDFRKEFPNKREIAEVPEMKTESEDEVEDYGPYYVKEFNEDGTDIDTIGFDSEQEAVDYAEENIKKHPDHEYAVYETATDECLYLYDKSYFEESKSLGKFTESDTGYDYWGPKTMEEFEGEAYIQYYGGPGALEYLVKARNGRYVWIDSSAGEPYMFNSYQDALKVQKKVGGEIMSAKEQGYTESKEVQEEELFGVSDEVKADSKAKGLYTEAEDKDFKVGDRVKIDYISDANEYNGQTGTLTMVRKYKYYPNGNADEFEYKTQGTIKFDDGKEFNIPDLNREGSGIVSPVDKVEEEMTLVESYDNEKDADVISKALARKGCKTKVECVDNKYQVWSSK